MYFRMVGLGAMVVLVEREVMEGMAGMPLMEETEGMVEMVAIFWLQ